MRKTKFLTLRLPGDIGAALAAAAAADDVSVSGYVRGAIVAALPDKENLPPLPSSPPPRPSVVPAEDLAVIAALGGQIGRLTGATIQLARTFREGGHVLEHGATESVIRDLRDAKGQIVALVHRLRAADAAR
jgi:hypothetical protein